MLHVGPHRAAAGAGGGVGDGASTTDRRELCAVTHDCHDPHQRHAAAGTVLCCTYCFSFANSRSATVLINSTQLQVLAQTGLFLLLRVPYWSSLSKHSFLAFRFLKCSLPWRPVHIHALGHRQTALLASSGPLVVSTVYSPFCGTPPLCVTVRSPFSRQRMVQLEEALGGPAAELHASTLAQAFMGAGPGPAPPGGAAKESRGGGSSRSPCPSRGGQHRVGRHADGQDGAVVGMFPAPLFQLPGTRRSPRDVQTRQTPQYPF